MVQCIGSLGDTKVFSTMDSSNEYWKSKCSEQTTRKRFRHWSWTVRIDKNADRFRKRAGYVSTKTTINLVNCQWSTHPYLLGWYTGFLQDFLRPQKRTISVLSGPKHAGVALKLNNYLLLTSQIDYPGRITRSRKLELEKCNAVALRNLRVSITVRKLRSFFGLCNVVQKFVPSLVRITSPLLTRLPEPQVRNLRALTKEEVEALEKIKRGLFFSDIDYIEEQ